MSAPFTCQAMRRRSGSALDDNMDVILAVDNIDVGGGGAERDGDGATEESGGLQPVWSTSKSKPSAIADIGRGSPNAEPIR